MNSTVNGPANRAGDTPRNTAPADSTTSRNANVAASAPNPPIPANAADDGARAAAGSAHSFTDTDHPSRLTPARADRLRPTTRVPRRTASTSSERNQDFM